MLIFHAEFFDNSLWSIFERIFWKFTKNTNLHIKFFITHARYQKKKSPKIFCLQEEIFFLSLLSSKSLLPSKSLKYILYAKKKKMKG